ncbi:MAG: hypothetical protein KatS3mg110_0577 [Pirellulaceae bacterium]|nr:MAG: hypothetical protein KatS3mg110_0577 [Pirellulaceae bacterium]
MVCQAAFWKGGTVNRANTVRVALAMLAVGLMAGLSCRKPSGTGAPLSPGGSSSSSARVVVNTTEDGLLEVAAQNGALDAEALAQVTDWSKVVQLRIQECGEVDDGLWQRIGTAENLKKLELIRVPVTDDDLQTLAACRSLEELLLAHTAVQGRRSCGIWRAFRFGNWCSTAARPRRKGFERSKP